MISSLPDLPVLVWGNLRSLQEIIAAFAVEYLRIASLILA